MYIVSIALQCSCEFWHKFELTYSPKFTPFHVPFCLRLISFNSSEISKLWVTVAKGFVDTKMIGYVEVDEILGDMLCLEGPASQAYLLGKTIVPAYQVEALFLCLRAVDEVLCVPGKKPGVIKAFVVVNLESNKDMTAPTAMLDALLEEDLIPEHHVFEVWGEMKTKSPKIDRTTLKALRKAVQDGKVSVNVVENLPTLTF